MQIVELPSQKLLSQTLNTSPSVSNLLSLYSNLWLMSPLYHLFNFTQYMEIILFESNYLEQYYVYYELVDIYHNCVIPIAYWQSQCIQIGGIDFVHWFLAIKYVINDRTNEIIFSINYCLIETMHTNRKHRILPRIRPLVPSNKFKMS